MRRPRERVAAEDTRDGARITAIFLLYNAAHTVRELVRSLVAQTDPRCSNQSEWLQAIFVDDCSRDETVELLRRELAAVGSPPHYRVILNEQNLGLAETLNKVLQQVDTPLALTCHCDCFFGRPDYIAAMRDLLCRHPDAALITGQPRLTPERPIPFVEKVNAVVNLMDVIPDGASEEVRPIGFAEGRCDGLRMAALEAVGLYRTTLRTCGEDQLLAAALRAKGYQVMQAPALTYDLLLSEEQNTLYKLVQHQRLFGRTHPFILLRRRRTFEGGLSRRAGRNRNSRAILRGLQLISAALYLLGGAALIAGAPAWIALAPLALAIAGRLFISRNHLRLVRPGLLELAGIWGLQPVFDIVYAVGFAQGIILAFRPARAPIR